MSFPYEGDELYCDLVKLVINSEGRYSNHPADPGGPTMFGVAWNYNATILKFMGVKDVRDLTIEQAKQIYYTKYWLSSDAHKVPHKALAYIHFDCAINCGVGAAKGFLERLSEKPWNFTSVGRANLALWIRLYLEYSSFRIVYYTHCKNRKSFLEGWMNRMASVDYKCSLYF